MDAKEAQARIFGRSTKHSASSPMASYKQRSQSYINAAYGKGRQEFTEADAEKIASLMFAGLPSHHVQRLYDEGIVTNAIRTLGSLLKKGWAALKNEYENVKTKEEFKKVLEKQTGITKPEFVDKLLEKATEMGWKEGEALPQDFIKEHGPLDLTMHAAEKKLEADRTSGGQAQDGGIDAATKKKVISSAKILTANTAHQPLFKSVLESMEKLSNVNTAEATADLKKLSTAAAEMVLNHIHAAVDQAAGTEAAPAPKVGAPAAAAAAPAAATPASQNAQA